FVGFPETLSVRIQNVGSLPLSITQTTIAGSGFSLLDPTSYVLGRGQYLDARITLAPEAPGSFSGTLTIESTDVGRPSVVVPLSGSMVYPPALEVSPSSLALAALNGASDSRVLELRNQGLGNMTYGLAAIGPQPSWLTFAP